MATLACICLNFYRLDVVELSLETAALASIKSLSEIFVSLLNVLNGAL
jgi:hypothetical protein